MNQYKRHATLFYTGAIVLVSGAWQAKPQCKPIRPAKKHPNIIAILADDPVFSDVGYYGSEINKYEYNN